MPEVVVVGHGPLTDLLVDRLREEGGCRRSTTAELTGFEAGAGDTWVYVAVAATDGRGIPDRADGKAVCERAAASGVAHLVLVASAAVHEPSAHHPGHVSESDLASRRLGNVVATGWLDLEQLAGAAVAGSDTALTVLRPAAVLTAGGEDYFSRLFAGRPALVLPGYDPSLQLLSPADLGDAVVRVVEKGPAAAGVYHLSPSAVMPLRKAMRAARSRRLPVPRWLHRLARKALPWAAPIDQLEYVRFPWTVSAEKIRRELGFEPQRSSARAIFDLASRGGPSTNAALGGPATDAPSGLEETSYDDFGMDEVYVDRLGRTLFRFLHDFWWRIEWKGLEHVPRQGRAVLAGVHRGHQPWDAVMTLHLLVRELGRYPRYLIHPTLVKFPFLAPYIIKCGGIHACQENADRVLGRDGLLAIFPEGIRGAFTMYRDAYKLGRFGRDDYVKIALRHGAPIIPYVTVGSAEIFPILGRIDWSWWKRHSEWPFFPVTPTMGTVPLPSKWHTWFLEPIAVDAYPPEAADDRETVKEISARVRRRMEEAIAEMLERRKSIWWGSVFEDDQGALGKEAA